MEKTKLMKRYEEDTGYSALRKLYRNDSYGYCDEYLDEDYNAWLEAKAEAYDRIMSGGRKTLKEWANMFGMVVAVDEYGEVTCFGHIPVMYLDRGEGIWTNSPEHFGEEIYLLPPHLIDFSGYWEDSLTLPDGWEEK